MQTTRTIAAATLAAAAGLAHAQVEHGRVDIEFMPFTLTFDVGNGDITAASPAAGIFNFDRASGADAFLQNEGVLLTNSAQINAFTSGLDNQTFVASTANNGGGWDVRTFLANGLANPNDPLSGPQDNGSDDPDRNIIADHDFNLAFFPFSAGWVSGTALPANSVSNGPLTQMFSSTVTLVEEADFLTYDGSFPALIDLPDLAVAPFIPLDGSAETKFFGRYVLHLPQFRNVHREGILLASSPSTNGSGESQIIFPATANNDNDSYISPFFPNLDPTKTLQLWVYDVNTSIGGDEADGVSFVYIPYGTTYTAQGGGNAQPLPMGLINGTALFETSQGPVSFERTRTDGDGIGLSWTEGELKVEGLNPDNATLLAVAAGGANQAQDNTLTYQPNADRDGWILQLRDGPTGAEDGLSPEHHAVQFVVLPDNADITPGAPENVDPGLTNFVDKTIAASYTVESLSGGNGRGTATAEPGFPAELDIQQVGGSTMLELVTDNRGDNVFALNGLLLSPLLGVTIPQLTELGRFDISGGSADEGGIDTRTYDSDVSFAIHNFENRVVSESLNNGDELNANFAMVHFPVESGFPQQPEVSYVSGEIDRAEVVPVATAAELGFGTDEGVLFSRRSANDDRFAVVDVDATQFEMRIIDADNQTSLGDAAQDPVTGVDTDSGRLGWVAMPYSTPGLIAAQVNADGSVANGTGGFTITQTNILAEIKNADLDGSGINRTYVGYNLVIPGVDSNTDGVLLLQGIGDPTESALSGFVPMYEAAPDGSFDIVVIDAIDRDTTMNDNVLDDDADTLAPFMFAFVPFTGLPGEAPAGCNPADVNQDGMLDFSDVTEFIGFFNAMDQAADVNGDTMIDFADVTDFIAAFNQGCPE